MSEEYSYISELNDLNKYKNDYFMFDDDYTNDKEIVKEDVKGNDILNNKLNNIYKLINIILLCVIIYFLFNIYTLFNNMYTDDF